jgi:hypothetical protein
VVRREVSRSAASFISSSGPSLAVAISCSIISGEEQLVREERRRVAARGRRRRGNLADLILNLFILWQDEEQGGMLFLYRYYY